MNERGELLKSIAAITSDYRKGELVAPTSAHVERWIHQFDSNSQLPMLREMEHLLKKTYFSRERVGNFLAKVATSEQLAGANPKDFWSETEVMDIQQRGESQKRMRQLFGEVLLDKFDLPLEVCGQQETATYLYLDDALFTGSRMSNDLTVWVDKVSPPQATVNIVLLVAYRYGAWITNKNLESIAAGADKDITFKIWSGKRLENRKSNRNDSDVFWPVSIPQDEELNTYINTETRFPFIPRSPELNNQSELFSSEEGRQLLEREFLLAGMKIRGLSREPKTILRPLGYSSFGLGFGSTIVTYNNCPNNAPLALWYGDPNAPSRHPFSKWYPLFQRRAYQQESY